ncbi:MAG: hypothetical protein RMN51_10110 [Verrucomicrobiota bacterium]|nr:hypothetical protein [Limisphaera sp.]MDW8382440.1 hypothetical protein [Verrucomicrobiota bacterium]
MVLGKLFFDVPFYAVEPRADQARQEAGPGCHPTVMPVSRWRWCKV